MKKSFFFIMIYVNRELRSCVLSDIETSYKEVPFRLSSREIMLLFRPRALAMSLRPRPS